jgi:hypothetical protein
MCRLKLLLVMLLGCSIAICAANQRAVAQLGSGRNDDAPAAENHPSEHPKAMIGLSIWILDLSEPHEQADAEIMAKLAERAENLSPVIGSSSEVRELVARMRAAGMLLSERSLRMVTLDGQPVTAQIGRNEPRVVGVSNDPRRGQTSSLVMEPIGIKIRALPQIDSDDQIQVSLEIGESNVEKSADVTISVTAEGGPQFADVVTTRQFTTTARTKGGSAVLLKCDASVDAEDASRNKTEVIILGAAVVDAPE